MTRGGTKPWAGYGTLLVLCLTLATAARAQSTTDVPVPFLPLDLDLADQIAQTADTGAAAPQTMPTRAAGSNPPSARPCAPGVELRGAYKPLPWLSR